MIVKNEEDVIGRCLDSVQGIADEMVIVDTGSTDRTKEIVKKYTEKLYDFPWIDDFAAARNFAFRQSTQDYILWLDADDVILRPDRERFLVLKNELDSAVDSVTMHYHLAKDEYGNITSSLRRNRLVKRAKEFQWIGAVHEYLAVSGMILNSDIAITHCSTRHDSDRNLRIYQGRLARGDALSPRDLYYYANELSDHGHHEEALSYYQKFLETKQGWVEDNIAACGKAADCSLALSDGDKQLYFLFKSFEYDIPRAECCCRLGFHYLQADKLNQAVYWYKAATELDKPADCWGMLNEACWTWLPHLQLCVCYDKLGQHDLAQKHNDLAAGFAPANPQILYNKKYFESLLSKTK
ncbi:MAG: glycosyltransferase family 2 protein [Negativicutes bacterium]|nr:glycosyltransferase family 2 protein [Negativicutes bacterium]